MREGENMVNLDCDRIYTRYDLQKEKPSGYLIVEKNHKHPKISPPRDRYKVVDIIEDIGIYEFITPVSENWHCFSGIILIEMVNPES